jgi:hypothetical protein
LITIKVLEDIVSIQFLNQDAKQLILDLQKLNVITVFENQGNINNMTIEIPNWQKELVNERLVYAKSHPEALLTWEEIEKELDA